MAPGRVLVIAGSDCSGGAGLEADQRVIAAHGCYAMTATTALTAQNTLGVEDIYYIPSEFVKKLIDVSVSDVGVDVVKTGMLASAETVEVVAEAIKRHHVKTLVVDPILMSLEVMVSTSGSQLLPSKAIRELRELLLPQTTILTPNVPEAKLLLEDAGYPVEDPKTLDGLKNIARALQSLGPKDGTVATTEEEKEVMIDILYGDGEITQIETGYQKSKDTHETAALASNLANGMQVVQAFTAHSYSRGHFVDYLLERPDVKAAWTEHTEHSFVAGLADGTLPMESFKYYLIQDYLYLVQFARANALASYKAKTMDDIAAV
ncbi:putative thiamine biosynthesis thi-4 protein [Rutstroemia sp. NJR-2017a BBW]|nr:putative thiamine biosynthesis thi-4 protein [Rutstroemia sp. NJR-2017a BBW]